MTTTDGSWEQRYDKLVADLHTLAERQRQYEELLARIRGE